MAVIPPGGGNTSHYGSADALERRTTQSKTNLLQTDNSMSEVMQQLFGTLKKPPPPEGNLAAL